MDANFLGYSLVNKLGMSTVPLKQATSLDDRVLCNVIHRSTPVILTFMDGHQEDVSFLLLHAPKHLLNLGYPWLTKHTPHIDLSTSKKLIWDRRCYNKCLKFLSANPACSLSGLWMNLPVCHLQKTQNSLIFHLF